MSDFDGKVAFVTGAGGGMGYRIACDLIDAGARTDVRYKAQARRNSG